MLYIKNQIKKKFNHFFCILKAKRFQLYYKNKFGFFHMNPNKQNKMCENERNREIKNRTKSKFHTEINNTTIKKSHSYFISIACASSRCFNIFRVRRTENLKLYSHFSQL